MTRFFSFFVLALSGVTGARAQAEFGPIALADTLLVTSGRAYDSGAFTVLRNDGYAGSDSLFTVLVSPPAHGVLRLSPDGSFRYTPEAGFEGVDRFSYRARTLPEQQLTIDEDASSIDFGATISNALLGADDDRGSVRIGGSVSALLSPASSSVDSIQVTHLSVHNVDRLALEFKYGPGGLALTLTISVPADSLGIDMLFPGPTAGVLPPFALFAQPGNKIAVSGAIRLSASGSLSGLVPSGQQPLDTETDWDIEQGGLTVAGERVSLVLPVALADTVDLDGNEIALDLLGSLLAEGPLVPSQQSAETWVVLNVAGSVATEPDRPFPAPTALELPYPSPTSGSARVTFSLGRAGYASVAVYDLLGRQIDRLAEGSYGPGSHSIEWDGTRFAPGLYLVRMEAAGSAFTQIVIKR